MYEDIIAKVEVVGGNGESGRNNWTACEACKAGVITRWRMTQNRKNYRVLMFNKAHFVRFGGILRLAGSIEALGEITCMFRASNLSTIGFAFYSFETTIILILTKGQRYFEGRLRLLFRAQFSTGSLFINFALFRILSNFGTRSWHKLQERKADFIMFSAQFVLIFWIPKRWRTRSTSVTFELNTWGVGRNITKHFVERQQLTPTFDICVYWVCGFEVVYCHIH